MKLDKIHEMNSRELQEELLKNKNELFNLRFQHVTGQLENPMRMKDVKRDIARIKTVIREQEIKQQMSDGTGGEAQKRKARARSKRAIG